MNHPVPSPGTSPAAPPTGRYGDRRTSRPLIAVLVVVGAALLGWLVWAALAAANPDTRSSLVSFRVLDDRRVEVRFEVIAEHESPVTCTVQAQDATGEAVGVTTVEVPAARADRREATAVLATRSRAVNATIAGCRLGSDD